MSDEEELDKETIGRKVKRETILQAGKSAENLASNGLILDKVDIYVQQWRHYLTRFFKMFL